MSGSAARRLIATFARISDAIDAAAEHLSELDGAIGDADHGISMALGFEAVAVALGQPRAELATPAGVLNAAAGAFLNAVGASTGPLYATGFRRAGERLGAVEVLDAATVAAMLQAFAAGVRERGKGQRGDKTMLDVWIPAAEAAAQAAAAGRGGADFWTAVTVAAEQGAAATASMVATRGRAARLGERSLGHVDPGAASAVIIIAAMADALDDLPNAA
ncbi:dihydroxyacetone kinase subunit DhaL [Segnochrobactrum spirostomi]|uniref:Dihydroxyacetone kinase subunit L n=1 Tax=Segnochrobactrum spirostomi TaxID=2608987 RepID=A0A6A7Y930_9HYPH|nr:dihydroxyacetone kinase subunit DhaL [Segnochrobactrum spirostomi]MQT15235.1 dihydroxyacetone kinase subunit L [Segnochrobactrum spirostomi]